MLSHFGNISSGRYTYSFQAQHRSLNEITLRFLSSKIKKIEQFAENQKVDVEGKYQTALQYKYYVKYAHSFEELRHGIISCLVLVKTLVYFMETDFDPSDEGRLSSEDARQFHIRNQILRAIASHTCPEVYHLDINTLSFLLILCDELQQWGRPTFEDMKLRATDTDNEGRVQISECRLQDGKFSAKITYPSLASDEFVRKRFLLFHKLMRSAIEDYKRQIHIKKFEWHVISKDKGDPAYKLSYESKKTHLENCLLPNMTPLQTGKKIGRFNYLII